MRRICLLLIVMGTLFVATPTVVQAQFGYYAGPRYRTYYRPYRPYYYGGARPYYSYYGGRYIRPPVYYYSWAGPRPYWTARPFYW